MKNKVIQLILLIVSIVYVVSPIDFCPGPIDDIILAVLTVVMEIMIGKRNKQKSMENNK